MEWLESGGLLIPVILILMVPWVVSRLNRKAARRPRAERRPMGWEHVIRSYEWPRGMMARALLRCPPGTDPALLDQGLREFLLACGEAPRLRAAMPSRTVDEAWHEFVLHTLDYAMFCDKAYGTFLHHRPEESMSEDERAHQGHGAMVATWLAATRAEGLERTTHTMPALFASDLEAGVPGAHRWIGWCGTDPCSALSGTVCLHHAHGMARSDRSDIRAARSSRRSRTAGGSSAAGFVWLDSGSAWGHDGHGGSGGHDGGGGSGGHDGGGGSSCSGSSCSGGSSCGGGGGCGGGSG